MLLSVVREAWMIAVAGVAFALAANAVSPRGLRLATDYFPAPVTSSESRSASPPPAMIAPANLSSPAERSGALAARLRQRGLQSIAHEELVTLFGTSGAAETAVILIDARSEVAYAKGHLPGARLLNPYRADQYLPELLPVCLTAEKIIVYCNGGDCEDSELAAVRLRDAGVPNDRLYIYPGGMQAWSRSALPIETGPRPAP